MLITQTPLRISLAGGGTDLPDYYRRHGGAVVSGAIDKYLYVILNSRFDDQIYISYSKKEIVDVVDDIRHELVREAMKKAEVDRGVEIAIMADIPSEGCGLGSSSSLTVGLLNAFYTYRGVQVPAERLAREACEIEIDICGKPIGKQDQYIAAYGGLRYFAFNADESVDVEDLAAHNGSRGIGHTLLLFYTNITRSADVILEEQKANTVNKAEFLAAIRALADRARDAIVENRYAALGDVLRENWEAKKELASTITNPAIDTMVARCMDAGAAGCKVCGAGGGGFLLAACPADRVEAVKQGMSDYREMPFFFERCGSKVIFNVESYDWK